MQPVLTPRGSEDTPLGKLPVVGEAILPAPGARLLLDNPDQPTAHKMTQTSNHQFDLGMYAEMHRRFDQGDLAKSIEHEQPMDTLSMMATPSKAPCKPVSLEAMPAAQVATPMMQNGTLETQTMGRGIHASSQTPQDSESEQKAIPTTEKMEGVVKSGNKEKPKKAVKIKREGTPAGNAVKQGPRCAACVKSHKRCTHRVQQSPTPQPGPNGTLGTPGAAVNNVTASGAPEGHTPAPHPIPKIAVALPNDQAAIPTPLNLEKGATTKRKR
jgi:hypothetical protein